MNSLDDLPASELIAHLYELRKDERAQLVEFLRYLGEVDRRKTAIELGRDRFDRRRPRRGRRVHNECEHRLRFNVVRLFNPPPAGAGGCRQPPEQIRLRRLRAQCGDQFLDLVLGSAGGPIQDLDQSRLLGGRHAGATGCAWTAGRRPGTRR
ncbi:MAG TPA: hypothetical protein VL172_13110 [Kofleriaceae bacterium]|nr:hypothetical protein [Kofleriaceae bacterium]